MSKKQHSFQFSYFRRMTWKDFIVGENEVVVHRLKHLLDNPPKAVYLAGPSCVGKTLLLEIIRDSYPDWQVVCVDNVSGWIESLGEQRCFREVNSFFDMDVIPVFTDRNVPTELGIQMPDLLSRLMWSEIYHVKPVPFESYTRMFQLMATRRGMILPTAVAEYLMQRWDRDLSAVLSMMDILDQTSMQTQRRLTIPFVRDVLKL